MTKYGFRDNEISVKKIKVTAKMPMQYVIPKTIAYSTGALLSAVDMASNGTAAISSAILIQPPYPMQVNVDAIVKGSAGNTDALTFVGKDAKGDTISEAVVISSTAATVNTSSRAFASITSITPNAVSPSTSVSVGLNNAVVGLPYPIEESADIISYQYDGAYSTTAVDAMTVNATYDTLNLGAGTAAAKVVQVVYKTKVQE